MSAAPVAVVTGVGPGTGRSIVEQLAAAGYRVAMLARDADRLNALAADLTGVYAYPVDVADQVALAAVCGRIETDLGAPQVLVHNAVGGAFGNFLDVDPAVLDANFQVNVMALMHLARRFAPSMVAAGNGSIIVTGNTSAQRGKANFAGFAPTKAAQRILAESIARELGPKGVHVAYVIIDAVIDVPWARKMHSSKPDSFFIQPYDIASEVLHLIRQPRSAWSFLAEIRPYAENW